MNRLALALLASTLPAMAADPPLPADVQTFVQGRAICDHWRGEEPYDANRLSEINRNTCKYCQGTDRKLANLKRKYGNNSTVISELSTLEERIEPRNPKERASLCKDASLEGKAGAR